MYYIAFAFIYLLSLLPMRVLYLLGDGIGIILFELIGYRKKIIHQNLRLSFPAKSEQELKLIAKSFQRNFIDTWMETIKFMTISTKEVQSMVQCDYSLFEEIHASGKSCQTMSGHFMNWELYNVTMPAFQPLTFLGIYMRLSSPAMEKLFRRLRGRFGSVLIPADEVKNGLEKYMQQPYMLALGADQSPSKPERADWMYFLQQPTAFPTGPSKNACRTNLPVVFTWLQKVKRGRYILHVEMLEKEPANIGPHAMTHKYVHRLQEVIQQYPDNYLWSHRRWKHAWQPAFASQWIDKKPMPQ